MTFATPYVLDKRSRYVKIEAIGDPSAFGQVFLAYDTQTGTNVVLKELVNPRAELRDFDREARILAKHIDNQHVVNILGGDMTATPPYIVMEFCEGGSLTQHIGKLTWEQVLVVLADASVGLVDIHRELGFHRDLKPANLLIAYPPDGGVPIVKVADFGLARIPSSSSGTMTRSPGGTPGYMAPELDWPNATYTDRCDIYSLGITAIELLTGKRDPASLVAHGAPEAVKDLLREMTSLAPWMRPEATSVLKRVELIFNPPPPPPPSPEPSPLSKPAAVLLGFTIGAVAAGAIKALTGGQVSDWDKSVKRNRGRKDKPRKN